jgi:hypothetical protein
MLVRAIIRTVWLSNPFVLTELVFLAFAGEAGTVARDSSSAVVHVATQ